MALFYLFAPVQRWVSWTTLQFFVWLPSGSWVSFYLEYAIFSFRLVLNLEPHSPEFNKPDFCFCNGKRVCLNEDWPSWNATQAVRQSKRGLDGMGNVSSADTLSSGQVMSSALLVLALHGGAWSCACIANVWAPWGMFYVECSVSWPPSRAPVIAGWSVTSPQRRFQVKWGFFFLASSVEAKDGTKMP